MTELDIDKKIISAKETLQYLKDYKKYLISIDPELSELQRTIKLAETNILARIDH